MNKKAFALTIILAIFMAFGMISTAFALSGPRTLNMEIHIYTNPDTENAALQAGDIDINDWPLTKTWVDAWALMPDQIQLRDYVELGMMEIDINNQQWPTGDSNNKFFKLSSQQSVKGLEFRKAVACLLDRDAIVRDVLKGYGYKMEVPLPPFQSSYIDMINYTASNVIYYYDKPRAEAILDAANFTMLGSGWRQDPLTPGVEMKPIVFYIRQDDPNRRRAGEMLTAELLSVGIHVNAIITERTVCYKNVMVLYAYNLYTGGWSLSTVPDQYNDLYSSYTYYGPSIGWSQNYPGFCNNGTLMGGGMTEADGFDYWAQKVKYPANETEAQEAAKTAGYLFLKYCAIVPMYCSKAVKAYRTGWEGMINNGGFGLDNYWTFLNAYNPDDDQIDWGFKSDIEQLNQVSSEWLWDQNVLGLQYESLLGTNPFNLALTEFFIANAKSVGSWDASSGGGDPDATYVNFTIRTNVKWHNNDTAGPAVTLDDIKFSFDFQKACGPGIAWGYPSLASYNSSVTYPTENKIRINYNRKSAWAVNWAGGTPIIRNATWSILWDEGNPNWRMNVKNYNPQDQDLNGNGLEDLFEDGCGAWVYQGYVQNEYVTLRACDYYYIDQATITTRLGQMFHEGAGDVDSDTVVDTKDLGYMARAMFRDENGTIGTGWNQYNIQCDLNLDGIVDTKDLGYVTTNYGRTAG
jgi:ABC-type transport system substrate-binding protein